MKRTAVIFEKPFEVGLREETVPEPSKTEVLVKTQMSAISAGSEMMVYKGLFPAGLSVDETIKSLAGGFKYPLKYGYATVGRITAVGSDIIDGWLGCQVFSFHPHESHFLANPADLIPVPAEIDPEEALFLPNMETAVNFLMDGQPVVGERVVVFGQGIVGLLTMALLSMFPLFSLVSLDRFPLRREASLALGANNSFDPHEKDTSEKLRAALGLNHNDGTADLVFELSGDPQALNAAIDITGFSGRIVIGSWYGARKFQTDLGGIFHRRRIRLISSQVSTIAPEYSGRWSKERRLQVTWNMIKRVRPAHLITHRFGIDQAVEAYQLLAQRPQEAIQIIFVY